MKVIKPVAIAAAMVLSSSVAEPSASAPIETAWVSGTTYAASDVRLSLTSHRLYKRGPAGAGTIAPENDPANWADIGPSNKMAMFDGAVNTQTSFAGTLVVVFAPGVSVQGVALMELVGTSLTVSMKDQTGGTVVYNKTINLDGTIISDWYQYFFEPYVQLSTVVLTDLPPYPNCEITLAITPAGGVAKCGICSVGSVYELGSLSYGATAGITDYSAKSTDAYGTTTVVVRNYAKRFDGRLILLKSQTNKVYSVLASLRSTLCVYIGTDDPDYAAPLVAYGFYKDFNIEIAYPTHSLCSLQVEGVT